MNTGQQLNDDNDGNLRDEIQDIPVANPNLPGYMAGTEGYESATAAFISGEFDEAEATSLPDIQRRTQEQDLIRRKNEDTHSAILSWVRVVFTVVIFFVCSGWMIFIGWFLTQCGHDRLKVSDAVQITLITTTTVNVLGICYIVANWLFPRKIASEPDGKG